MGRPKWDSSFQFRVLLQFVQCSRPPTQSCSRAGWDSQESVAGNLGNLQLRKLEKMNQKIQGNGIPLQPPGILRLDNSPASSCPHPSHRTESFSLCPMWYQESRSPAPVLLYMPWHDWGFYCSITVIYAYSFLCPNAPSSSHQHPTKTSSFFRFDSDLPSRLPDPLQTRKVFNLYVYSDVEFLGIVI